MVIWDFIALVTGIGGVILTIRESIWCWPIALISVIISGITFFNERLFGDFCLQVFYLISGLYGWYYWNKNKSEVFVIHKMPGKLILPLIMCTIIQAFIYYFLLKYFKSDQFLFDAILTACSFTGTFMMAKKWLENWLIWIFVDIAYVFLYLIKDLSSYALLYVFFAVMAGYGFNKWKKQLVIQ